MQLTEEAQLKLTIDGKPALNALGELEKKYADLKTAQDSLTKGTKEYADSKKEIAELEAEIKKVRSEMGVAGLTVKQLTDYQKQLNKELKDLVPNTEAYINKSSELKDVNTRLQSVRDDVRGVSTAATSTQSVWTNVKSWIMTAFTVTAIIEAGKAIYNFAADAVKNFRDYQSAAAQLSAITGLVGQDLKFLTDTAKETGPALGLTATEMLKAYQVMGSAKPDLLANKELLAATTREAIILSQAAGIDLVAASEAVASSLNQFGEGADQANRYVNVMAAGAKEGAAEIQDMAGSLKASGTVAAAAGLSFEQTNAALQSMSTIALKGEQAGTMLRNVLLKLQSGADDTNPKIVGLEKALENLGNKNLSTAEMAKLFGTENVVAAQHLVTHRDEVEALTEKLTGTDEAYTQAAKNTETLDHKIKVATATLTGISLALGEKLAPAVGWVIDGFLALYEASDPLGVIFNVIVGVVGDLFSALGGLIKVSFPSAISGAVGLKDVMAVVATVLNLALVPIRLTIAAIKGLTEGFFAAKDGVSGFFKALSGDFTGAAKSFESAKSHLNNIGTIGKDTATGIKDSFVKIWTDNTKAVTDSANHTNTTNTNTNKTLANQNATHRTEETEKEKNHREKLASDRKKIEDEAAKQTQKMLIDAITDEQTRKKKLLEFELNEKLATEKKKLGDSTTYLNLEIALRGKYKTDVEKLDKEYSDKKKADEAKAAKERVELENQIATQTFAVNKNRLEQEITAQKTNNDQRKTLKLDLLKLEKDEEIRKIEEVATKERERATGNATALKAIEDNLLQAKTTANNAYNEKVKAIEADALKQRLEKTKGFYSELSGALSGDLKGFANYLMTKLGMDDKNLSERKQKQVAHIDGIGNALKSGLEAMGKLNDLYTQKQLSNIDKEKTKTLDAYKKQYESGVLNKDQYEKKVAELNKKADEEAKAIKLQAFKREQAMNITMALINGAQAALKSLAIAGFPLGLIGVAAAAVQTGIQIAMIKSQKPSFRKGGYIRNAGVPEGPNHGASYGTGGIALVRRDTNEEVGEMEGKEPILMLSQNLYKNNGRVIDRLLHSSLHQNGAAIFKNGGLYGSDGGSYQDYVEAPQFGEMYLFGSRKRKKEAAAAQQQAEEAQAESQQQAEAAVASAESAATDTAGTKQDINTSFEIMEGIKLATEKTVEMLGQNLEIANENKSHTKKMIEMLENIADSSRRTADKPPVSITQIIQEKSKHDEVTNASTF